MKEIGLGTQKIISGKEASEKIIDCLSQYNITDKRILVICEDNTRATPVNEFFEGVMSFLRQRVRSITVLFALGTHRPMTREEMMEKLGINTELASQIRTINHNASDDSQLVTIGWVDNVPIKLNKAIIANDIVLGIGGVIPHRVMGFSGGGKILCPGIGNKEMIDHTHWKSNLFPEHVIMGKVENPMRSLLDEIVSLAESSFPEKVFLSVNCVSIPSGIVDLFVGNFISSYNAAAKLSHEVFVKKVESCSRVLALVDDKSVDFWQAAKAVYNCARVINEGGFIVVRGKLQEGISKAHGDLIQKFGYSTPAKVRELYDGGELKDQVVASHMIRVSQHLERVKIILSSENINEEMCRQINLGYLKPEKIVDSDFDYMVHNAVDILLTKD